MTSMRVLAVLVLFASCAAPARRQPTFYPNGQPHEEYEMRAGMPHGRSRVWHAKGLLASEGNYVAGKREGKFVFYTDTGHFDYQALFHRDEEIWRSRDPDAKPDHQALLAQHQQRIKTTPTQADLLPLPWFASVDRTISLDRVGAQLGFGELAGLEFGASTRFEAFANYTVGDLGGYAQFSQSWLEAMSGSVSYARALEGGGTYRLPFDRFGATTARLGVLVPLTADTTAAFAAGSAGSFHRPTDAAAGVPASVAIRTGGNLVRVGKRFVLQTDAGLDWLFGGAPNAFEPLARANVGVGFGTRSRLIAVELTNTMSLVQLDRRLHAAGISGGMRVMGAWVSGLLSYCVSGGTAFTTVVGYEL